MLGSSSRPDFMELSYIYKDIMRMDNCSHYLNSLLLRSKPQLYPDMATFISLKKGIDK